MERSINSSEKEALDNLIIFKWKELLSQPFLLNFSESLMGKDNRVYALYLTQLYHYSKHTARTFALVAVSHCNSDIRYMQFCLEHALEEIGLEQLVLNDLHALGVPLNADEIPPPLPETDLLIAYLYRIATYGSPVQRLGYSYWAEGSHKLYGEFIESVMLGMGLQKKQRTYFYNHAMVEDKHFKGVEEMLAHMCRTPDDWQQVMKTASITIDLIQNIIKAVLQHYSKLIEHAAPEYEVLNEISS